MRLKAKNGIAGAYSLVLIALFIVAPISVAYAAEPEEDDRARFLCRGNFQTQAEAREQLARFQRSYSNLDEWKQRAATIREGILRGAELLPPPKKCDLNPIFHGRRDYEGYSVQNVAFESLPGFFVAGNLYRPRPIRGQHEHPGMLCPHGHYARYNGGGRFRDDMQKRCACFARMGAVVFAYDMVGWGESTQYPHGGEHGNKALAVQLWNSMRVIDFLLSLNEVDPERIGATGASGGALQTVLITAVDERIALSIPVVTIAAHCFGNCACASGMPIHRSEKHETNNAEITALAAPRPLLLISIGHDWTKNTPLVEFPYIRHVYELYGAESKAENLHLESEKHNYGYSKRVGAYKFLAKHFGMALANITNPRGMIDESWVEIEPQEMLMVFGLQHPMPDYAVSSPEEVELLLRTR